MSIHSVLENDFVMSLGDGNLMERWTGGRAPSDNHTYEWSDGTAWSFEHWAPGQPSKTRARCIKLNSESGWDDVFCNILLNFVCKKKNLLHNDDV